MEIVEHEGASPVSSSNENEISGAMVFPARWLWEWLWEIREKNIRHSVIERHSEERQRQQWQKDI